MEARGGPSRPASVRASARIHCKNCGFLHVQKTHGGPSRPASGRASARIHCKNCGFLHDSLTWRPEGTRDCIILNKSHQGPPRTFGRRGSHVAEEPCRILVLCGSQVTVLSVSGGRELAGCRTAAALWHKGLYYICVTYVHDYVDPLRTCVLWYYYNRFVKKYNREEGTRNQLARWFLVAPHA